MWTLYIVPRHIVTDDARFVQMSLRRLGSTIAPIKIYYTDQAGNRAKAAAWEAKVWNERSHCG
jgi:DUF1365 family protein